MNVCSLGLEENVVCSTWQETELLQKGKHTGILLIQSHNFLIIFLQEREEIASIDLRRMTEFKGPEQGAGYEASCSITIVLPDRYISTKIIHLNCYYKISN